MDPKKSGIGGERVRREDRPLVTGRAEFTDDLTMPRMAYMAVLRSTYGHARISEVDTRSAETVDGVLGVFTAEDVADSDARESLATVSEMASEAANHPLLATDRVRYQGQPVAVVVAEDRYTANDAVEEVAVKYDREETVVDPVTAASAGSTTLYDEIPDNTALDWELGDSDAVIGACEDADHTISVTVRNQRLLPNPMEPRVMVADYDHTAQKLSVKLGTQTPHKHRSLLADTLGLPEHRVRVETPAVGGGFGQKGHHYPDEALTAWCSMLVDRPVKWSATRTEDYVAGNHGRDHVTEATIGVSSDGSIESLHVDTLAGLGAYVFDDAPSTATVIYGTLLSGPYDIPQIYCRVRGILTNTTPIASYRGAGRPEAIYLLERLVRAVADELDFDPIEVRRRNFIPPEAFPHQVATGLVYDSGDYDRTLEIALDRIDYDELRERQRRLRSEGRYLGIGVASFVESAGPGPSAFTGGGPLPTMGESAIVRFHPSGTVTAYCGTASQGQGHETTYAQVIAEELGVDEDDVEVIEGDTDAIPYGTGTFGSRSGSLGGGAIARAARDVVDQARHIAARQLEVSESDVNFEDGEFSVEGAPEQSITIQDVARAAYLAEDLPEDVDFGLEATNFYDPENFTFPFGTHAVVVEVDPGSGEVEILRYVAVDDCGTQINPTIVEGQVHGSIAQGVGQALYEGVVYDENGNLLTGSMQDYCVPKAYQIPEMETQSTVTPSPHNPIGVKGVGEAGTIAAPPALVNAIEDALDPFEFGPLEMPLTPETIWAAVRGEEE